MHLYPTSRAPGDERFWGDDLSRLARGLAHLQDHQPQGVSRDGTAGMPEAEVSDFHEAFGEHVLEEAAEKLDGVERGAYSTEFCHPIRRKVGSCPLYVMWWK